MAVSNITWTKVFDADGTATGPTFVATATVGVYVVAIDENGLVYRSTDSGKTWAILTTLPGSAPSVDWSSRLFTNSVGNLFLWFYPSGSGANELIRSTDAGATWTTVYRRTGTGSNDYGLGGCVVSGSSLITVGLFRNSTGTIISHTLTSSDDGASWAPGVLITGFDTGTWATTIALMDDGTLLAGSYLQDYIIARSTDGGATWTPVTLPGYNDNFYQHEITSIVPLGSGAAMVTGGGGNYGPGFSLGTGGSGPYALFVWRTADYGVTYTLLAPSEITTNPGGASGVNDSGLGGSYLLPLDKDTVVLGFARFDNLPAVAPPWRLSADAGLTFGIRTSLAAVPDYATVQWAWLPSTQMAIAPDEFRQMYAPLDAATSIIAVTWYGQIWRGVVTGSFGPARCCPVFLDVSWNPALGAEGYEVAFRRIQDTWWTRRMILADAPTNLRELVLEHTAYEAKVRAFSRTGAVGAWTAASTVCLP